MAGVEHEHGTRLLAVARLWDRCVVAAHTHRLQETESKRLVGVVHKVVHSVSTLEQYPRLTITDREAGTIHYETDKECIYLLVTAPDYPQRTAFRCLDELRTGFRAQFFEASTKAAEHGLSMASRSLLAELCARFDDPAAVDKVLHIQRDVDEVQGVMHEAVRGMLANRENLEVLEDRAEFMQTEGLRLATHSRFVRREFGRRQWCSKRLICLLVAVAIVCFVVIPVSVHVAQAGHAVHAAIDEFWGNLTTWDGTPGTAGDEEEPS